MRKSKHTLRGDLAILATAGLIGAFAAPKVAYFVVDSFAKVANITTVDNNQPSISSNQKLIP